MSLTQPIETNVVCPYCGFQKSVKFTETYPSGIEVQCGNSECIRKWHQGCYRVAVLKIGQQNKRGLGKDCPTIYNIRCKDNSGGEHLIEIRSRIKGIMMKKGDIIVLSYSKKSRGLFHKEWTKEWESNPNILLNNTLHTYWKI